MEFKVGQTVIIGTTAGEKRGYDKGRYYHGETIRKVPLGAKAVIDRIDNKDMIHLVLENKRYGDSGGWYVHPDELKKSEEQEKAEREAQIQIDSILEQTLLIDPDAKEVDEETAKNKVTQYGRRILNRVIDLFCYHWRHKEIGNPFKPKFNPREEFAVWLEQEFPDWKKGYGAVKGEIRERGDEIYDAARQACKHGIETTESCVQTRFRRHLGNIRERENEDFYLEVNKLVGWIKAVSANLIDFSTEKHYGTRVVGERD